MTEKKKMKIWIYEYKDDDTAICATFVDKFVDEIENFDVIKLPHLNKDWHWEIQFSFEEDE
jgi:hypothetical protein